MTPHVSITLLRTQTDERLVELIAAGHDRAFDAIVDRYSRPLLRYARRFLREEARAEDVVQAAFVSAWAALRDGATVRDLRPWLYRIVHNGALNAMKKPGGDDAPLIEASDLRPGPAAEFEQREDVRVALDTIAALPDRQRAALLAVALEGRSHADIGAELGLNDSAVRQLVRRARTTLRVAATAVTPWPVAVWLAGVGAPQAADTATRVGELVGGVGAGTLFGGSALKAGAIVAAAGAVAVSVPQVDHVVRERQRPAAAQATAQAAAQPSTDAGPAGASGPAATQVSSRATPVALTPSARGGEHSAARSRGDDRQPAGGRSEDRGPGERGTPGGSGDDEGRDDDAPAARHEPGAGSGGQEPRSGRREHRSSSGAGGDDDGADDHGEREVREQPEPEAAREQPEAGDDSSGPSWSGSGGSEGSGGSDDAEHSGSGSATKEHAETEESGDDGEHESPSP